MNSLNIDLNIRQNNKGSAMLTVVVTMLFVMVLGSALLFAAYTGYTIKIAEREDSKNFYDASAAMDDIRAGIQTQVTTAIAKAYTDVLMDFSGDHASSYSPQNDLNTRFINELAKKTVTTAAKTTVPLFVYSTTPGGNAEISSYNADGLKALIDTQFQAASTLSSGSVLVKSTDGVISSISLQTISLNFINDKGYESDITTDITVNMPDFFAGSSVTSSINNSSIIADVGLTQSHGEVIVDGGVYVGSGGISVLNNGDKLTLQNGTVICKGPISVGSSATFNFSAAQSELWANKITLGSSAKTVLDGKVFVADDLVLSGGSSADKTSATLRNMYFGFGNDIYLPSSSSSILVNGRNSVLDISKLDKLSLAGVSFIDISGESLIDSSNVSVTDPIMMGESMSAKANQLAYLVPEKCITNFASNPCIFDTTPPNSPDYIPKIDTNKVLWGTGANEKKLSDYIDPKKGQIITMYKNVGNGLKIAYVFLVFSDRNSANAYFKDYFSADQSNIEQYIDLYLTLSDKADNAQISTAGNSFYNDDNNTPANSSDDKLTLVPASDRIYAEGYQTRFNNMKSPYRTYVNLNAIDTLLPVVRMEFKNSNKLLAIVSTEDNFDYDASSDPYGTVRLIIATKNVTIDKAFNGVIIAGNTVILHKSVTSALLNSDIMNSSCTYGGTNYVLSTFVGSGAQLEGSKSTGKDAWDLDSLVVYENWTKK